MLLGKGDGGRTSIRFSEMPPVILSTRTVLVPLALIAGLSGTAVLQGQACTGDIGYSLSVPENVEIGTYFNFCLTTPGNDTAFLLASLNGGPTPTSVGDLCVGFPFFAVYAIPMPAGGNLCLPHLVPCDPALVGATGYFQFVAINGATGDIGVSNGQTLSVADGDCSPCDGKIGNFVWEDLNGNHLQDASEPGIPGVQLILKDADGNVLLVVATDANGMYEFRNLCAGDYTVEVDPGSVPPTLGPVLCDIGSDDAIDSDCQPAPSTLVGDFDFDDTLDFGYALCGDCSGKVSALTLRYDGATTASVKIKQEKKKTIVFDDTLDPGESFTIFGQASGVFGKEIKASVDGGPDQKLHTSCSKPVGPGVVFGDFTVLAGASLNGGILCPAGPNDCVSGGPKPQMLDMLYTGHSCVATQHSQGDKAGCVGALNGESPVQIIAFGSDGEYFNGIVSVGEVITIDSNAAGLTKFKANTQIQIFDLGGNLLQDLFFHTSCSKPLAVGNVFGGLELLAITFDGP